MSKGLKIFIGIVLVAALVAVSIGVYRMHFEFNDQDVKDYINEEADQYPEDKKAAVYKIIKDGVEFILSDRDLTQQVRTVAKANGTPKEFELVHAAIMQAKSFNYL